MNFRTRKKSYKTKTVIYTDESEWVTFEDTHEAIIDRETYDTVQRLREAKRRLTRMGEMSVFSGMLFCSDCGNRLCLNRCNGKNKETYSGNSKVVNRQNYCFRKGKNQKRIQKNSNNISNPPRRNRIAIKDKKTGVGVSFSPTPVSLMVTP